MNTPTMLPFEPLERLLARFDVNREPVGHNASAIAHLAGVNVRQVHRWRAAGISINVADRVCARVGHHPAELWDWTDDTVEVA